MMAEADDSGFSLMSLEDELTCSICLSTFDCPVTIPCGHNFCQNCLLATWKDSYSCPQCRTLFATRPELKKNTVLSTVVETFRVRSNKTEGGGGAAAASKPEKKRDVVRCDTCMEAEAAQTCLTCMASFCEEHLRPHRENPIFRLHQLSPPVGDLMERICTDHHKLMELFCSQHQRPICSLCLQQVHKGCSFTSPEEQRSKKEVDLREKLVFLDGKLSKNESVISQMRVMQNKLRESAIHRKSALSAGYQQMRDMMTREEGDALKAIDKEVETGETKIRGLISKFSENVDNIGKAKEEIFCLLGQSQTLAFLQTSFNLPQAVSYDPYSPRITLDSKKVVQSEAFALTLKNYLTELLKQPVEARIPKLIADPSFPLPNPRLPRSHSPAPQAKPAQKKKPQKAPKNPSLTTETNPGNKKLGKSIENLMEFGVKEKPRGRPAAAENKEVTETTDIPSEISSAEKRSDLMKYGTVLNFDQRTAHKRIELSENFTKASVSDEHTNYPDCPERFAVCSQVMASKGFSAGRHYWEVRLSSNNFIGIGLAYSSIDRKGPTSRLGRNSKSWCVEWFNVKLSAWHNSSEAVLVNPNPKRVGVLLDCEEGRATFYNVADRAYPFHSFSFQFAEAVYPAFWIFSSGSYITLCKLQ
ncbi:E3 ubiquitin/ISG15 ligase TRIM25 isoform X3 [Poecilia latipinna]|uniref:Tripartite motif containing 25 n=1 Tax=Poecilia mexicana TaxID=48701 RepID=A0A3B3WF40_9TELE|nr:PREDICTED: E3 ubiquitin/ISG15 ligase TRIM25-like isoform X3 [Poecilia mexicana]XP_014913042.1 PREDICTED: E3 ubiquitin/ISG15 ligase TRIM25-like isoform X3 [Poecilia latipinna]XP_016522790.1 PREDICTED: E3 ubiquitin/ISG15 ligase TRIM25-like isoform X3 [Poecilia formosa]